MAYFYGLDGHVDFGGTTIEVTTWEATDNSDILETTNTGSGGFGTNIAGIRTATGSFEAPCEDSSPNYGLSVGTNITFTGTIGAGHGSFIANCRIKSIAFTNPAKSIVTLKVDWESNGSVSVV